MSKVVPVIAIDGPSGSGKGTIARRVASSLGWHLLDSGALYRLLALAAGPVRMIRCLRQLRSGDRCQSTGSRPWLP